MIKRVAMWSLVLGAAFVVAACGGGSEDSATAIDTPTTAESTETIDEAPVEVPTEEAVADEPAADEPVVNEEVVGRDGCENILTIDEIDSILGTTAEISGAGRFCRVWFADDSVGSIAMFTDSMADDAMDELLPKFLADEIASANGVLLDDGRGFIDDFGLTVRGDSGRVFTFGLPRNVELADRQAAMLELVELLLPR